MKTLDSYSFALTSGRGSSFLPLLTNATGMPGAAIWSGMLTALEMEPARPARWFCPALSYPTLLKRAVAFLPAGTASTGNVTPGDWSLLSRSIDPACNLVAGPLDRSALVCRPVPVLWDGAPLFVEIASCGNEEDMVIVRIPGLHPLARVPTNALRPLEGDEVAWFACRPLERRESGTHLERARKRATEAPLTALSESMAAASRGIADRSLTSTEKHCLRCGLAWLQECLWDATDAAHILQADAPGRFSRSIARAIGTIELLAHAPSALGGRQDEVASYLLELARALAETETMTFLPEAA